MAPRTRVAKPRVTTAATATTQQSTVRKPKDPYNVITPEQREDYTKRYYKITNKKNIPIDRKTIIDLFLKAGLQEGEPESIFAIADKNKDGFLDLEEFIIMYHISTIHHSTGAAIPTSLPNVFEPASQRKKIAIRTANTAETSATLVKAFLSRNSIDVSFVDRFTKAINKVVEIEMNDNEFMTNADIIFHAKLQQLDYFLQQESYKSSLVAALQHQDIDLLTNILMQYDPQVYPAQWNNETQRLTSSIIEKCEPNSAYTCPRCKQEKVFSTQRQVRSADEGVTSFFRCCNCGYIWQEN